MNRVTALGRVVSAVLTVGAVVLAVIKWSQRSADQILPILFAGAMVATAVVSLYWGVRDLARYIVNPWDREPLLEAAVHLAIGAFVTWVVLDNSQLKTLVDGQDRSDDLFVPFVGFVASAAIAATAIMSVVLMTIARRQPGWAPKGKRLCPDCAEFPKAAASVCRYCGHRFEPLP